MKTSSGNSNDFPNRAVPREGGGSASWIAASLGRLALGLLLVIPVCLQMGCKGHGEGLIPLQQDRPTGWQCNVPFTDLFHHNMSGFFNEEDFRVIDNPDDWCALWPKMTTSPYSPPPCDLSLVDFSREVAILAADPRSVWLSITCVQGDDTSARVRVLVEEMIQDPPDCILWLRPNYPVHVVKVDRVALVATFEKEPKNICSSPP